MLKILKLDKRWTTGIFVNKFYSFGNSVIPLISLNTVFIISRSDRD